MFIVVVCDFSVSREVCFTISTDSNCVQINKYAFSGGQDSVENHRKYGANLEVLKFTFSHFTDVFGEQ